MAMGNLRSGMTAPYAGPGRNRRSSAVARRRSPSADEHCTCEVVCSPPNPSEARAERWLFEWTLDVADCEGVTDVSVARVPDRDAGDGVDGGADDELLQVSIRTDGECENACRRDDRRRVLERLERVAAVHLVACYRGGRPTVPME